MERFEGRKEEYGGKVEEVEGMKEEGRIKRYVKVGEREGEVW